MGAMDCTFQFISDCIHYFCKCPNVQTNGMLHTYVSQSINIFHCQLSSDVGRH